MFLMYPLNVMVALPPPALRAKPDAPLLNPSTKAESGSSAFDTAVFKTKDVNV